MATLPPSPFTSSAEVVMPSVDKAAASPVHTPGTVDAAANISPGDCLSSLPSGESDPSVTLDLAPGENRFVLDEIAFMEAIEPLPLFLQAPIDVMSVLASY